jgi:hypothetical protein
MIEDDKIETPTATGDDLYSETAQAAPKPTGARSSPPA